MILLENKYVEMDGNKYDLFNDLTFVGSYTGQRPYLRRNTKINVYKDIKNEYPDIYSKLISYNWFQPYKKEVEDIKDIIIPNEVRSALNKVGNEGDGGSSTEFQNAINLLATKIGDMSTKIDTMNTNTKLEEALIEGIVSKGKDLATEEVEV